MQAEPIAQHPSGDPVSPVTATEGPPARTRKPVRRNAGHRDETSAGGAKPLSRIDRGGTQVVVSTFTPRSRHPVFEVPMDLATEPANRVLENTYDAAQASLYHLYTIMPISMRDRADESNAVLALVEEQFAKLEAELEAEHGRLKHLANVDGAAGASGYYHETKVVVQVLTPAMTRYLALITRMDSILRIMDALWFSTRINTTERTNRMMEWRNKITRFHRFLSNTHTRSANSNQRRHVEALASDAASAEDAGDQVDLDVEGTTGREAVQTAKRAARGGKRSAAKPAEPSEAAAPVDDVSPAAAA